jgi:hypothetical protein
MLGKTLTPEMQVSVNWNGAGMQKRSNSELKDSQLSFKNAFLQTFLGKWMVC